MSEIYLNRHEAGAYLRERFGFGSAKSLAVLACKGGGPLFRKMGKLALYTPDDLKAWVQAKMTPARDSASAHRIAANAGESVR
jgi:hypothetical protein